MSSRQFVIEATLCVCSHPYGDHAARGPHRCLEASSSRAGHACSCSRFQPPATGAVPDVFRLTRDGVFDDYISLATEINKLVSEAETDIPSGEF